MSNSSSGSNAFVIIISIYLIISQFMALYFWWDWAQDNGFWSTLIIGPVVAEFKGLLWMFFI